MTTIVVYKQHTIFLLFIVIHFFIFFSYFESTSLLKILYNLILSDNFHNWIPIWQLVFNALGGASAPCPATWTPSPQDTPVI